MKNARGDGRTIRFTAGADVSSGAFVAVGGLIAVAANDVANGAEGTGFIEGEYEGTAVSPVIGGAVTHNGTNWVAAGAGVRAQGVVTRVITAGASGVAWVKLTPGGTGS